MEQIELEMDVPFLTTCASLGNIGVLLPKLYWVMASGITLPCEVKNEVELLIEDVKKMNKSLVDLSEAEDLRLMIAKLWMKEARELSYDMEDYFDQVLYSGAGEKVAKPVTGGKTTGLLVKISGLTKLKRRRRSTLHTRIMEFRTRVQKACEEHKGYGLSSLQLGHRFVSYGPRLPTLRPDPVLIDHGTMDDLLDTGGEKQLKVVSIVGPGGVGKTTLAKSLYHKLRWRFQCRAFVRVSSCPDMRRILTSIFSQIRRQLLGSDAQGPYAYLEADDPVDANNDRRRREYFDADIPHTYLDANENDPDAYLDTTNLIAHIAKHLQNKRYFIIIDDLWAASVWDIIRRAFPDCSCCSRLITTTQIEDVSLACCSYRSKNMYEMRSLDHDHARELFVSRIFESVDDFPQEFKEVSHGILRECAGLPLSIVNIGSLLASEPVLLMEHWKYIYESLCSNSRTNPFALVGTKSPPLPGKEKKVQLDYPQKESKRTFFLKGQGEPVTGTEDKCLPKSTYERSELMVTSLRTERTSEGMEKILNLVYRNLPPHLKTCLLYLNMYPEGYTIKKDDLVRQWTAEGFVSAFQGQDTDELAGDYFDELISRGLIQPVDTSCTDGVLSCTVSHMVLDLIAHKSMEGNFNTVVDYFHTNIGPDKVRRLSVKFGSAKRAQLPPASFRVSQVRSLIFFGYFKSIPFISEYEMLRIMVLHIWADHEGMCFDLTRICELLFRLRYLKITGNCTVNLPAKIQGLKDLETLEVDARVATVPLELSHLPRLLHLRLPIGFHHQMTSLLTLHVTSSRFNEKDIIELLHSTFESLRSLKSLTFSPSSSCSRSVEAYLNSVHEDPPALLQRLELSWRSCIISRLPSWIRGLGKLCILKIAVREISNVGIGILKALPLLTGLSLHVRNAPSVRIVIDQEGFPVLKYFKFRCPLLCFTFQEGAMPNLQRLNLGFCVKVIMARNYFVRSHMQFSSVHAGFEHLLNLKEIYAKIWPEITDQFEVNERTSIEANMKTGISALSVDINWVDLMSYHQKYFRGSPHRDSDLPTGSSRCEIIPGYEEDTITTGSTQAVTSLLRNIINIFKVRDVDDACAKITDMSKKVMVLEDEQLAGMAELSKRMKDGSPIRELAYDVADYFDYIVGHLGDYIGMNLPTCEDTEYRQKLNELPKFIDQVQEATSIVMGQPSEPVVSGLPCDKKSCLLYLTSFPENHVIRKDRLIWRWITEGFVPTWEKGENYFQDLIGRKLIEPADCDKEDDEVSVGCRVHGLVFETITSLCIEENFVMSNTQQDYFKGDVVRRLSVHPILDDDKVSRNLSKVRALTCFGDVKGLSGLPEFRFLRVLDFEDASNLVNGHFQGIGNLSLLRYLGFRGTGITELPVGISTLNQLEALDVRRTGISATGEYIVRLPRLVRLLAEGVKLRNNHSGIGRSDEILISQNLQEISIVIMDDSQCWLPVATLLKLNQLRILGVRWAEKYRMPDLEKQNVRSFLQDVKICSNLRALFLHDFPAGCLDLVLESCVPRPPHLQEFGLEISGLVEKFPHKIPSLVNLTRLDIGINDALKADDLHILGRLPKLVLLRLHSTRSASGRLCISSGEFRLLKVLRFSCGRSGMGLRFKPGSMPNLRKLELHFNAHKTNELYGDFEFGIQHLSSLQHVSAKIYCDQATVDLLETVEEAIKNRPDSQDPNSHYTVELIREAENLMKRIPVRR